MSSPAALPDNPLHGELGHNGCHVRRNGVLGVLSGAFAESGRDFIHPELILVGLVTVLTGSYYAAAAVPLLNKLGGLAPQLIVSSMLEHSPRRRPYFVAVTFVRLAAHVGLVASMWLLTQRSDFWGLGTFYLAYFLVCVSDGTAHVVFMDMVGRLIPSGRVGAFLGWRSLLGGVLAIGAGFLIIQPITGAGATPPQYLILAIIGTTLLTVDMILWCFCREEPGVSARTRTTLVESLRRGRKWLREHHNYRCYFYQRIAFRFNYLLLVFFIPYGRELYPELGPAGLAVLGGIMVGCMKLSRVLTGGAWGRLVDRHGSRRTLIVANLLLMGMPVVALIVPHLPTVYQLPLPRTTIPLDLPLTLYLLALVMVGSGMQGSMIAGQQFLIVNAPPHRRASYIAFLNTITSPLTLLPMAGAWIADVLGMPALFGGLFFCGGVLAVVSSYRMQPEPHIVARAQPARTRHEAA